MSERVHPRIGEGLPRRVRLRQRRDFRKCYETGRREHGSLAVLHVSPNGLDFPRLGITASRRVGPAVTRHQAKRRVREVFRRWNQRPRLPALDIVVHLRPAAGAAGFQELRADLERLLGRLLEPRSPAP